MSLQPSVSAIIPVYNCEQFIQDALLSIVQQTRAVQEVIIIDDGSTDATAEQIQQFVQCTPTLSIRYQHQHNQGVASARSHGVRLAQGEVIAFLDADDCWYSYKTALQLQLLQLHPEVGMVIGNSRRFGLIAQDPPYTRIDQPKVEMHLQSTLIRRACFEQIGHFDDTLRLGEDVEWIMRWHAAGGSAFNHSDAVVLYRRHANNMTNDYEVQRMTRLHLLARALRNRRAQNTTEE